MRKLKTSFQRLSEAVALPEAAEQSKAQRRGMLCVELLFAFYAANVFVMRAFLIAPEASLWFIFLCLPPVTAVIFYAMRLFMHRFGQGFGIAPLQDQRGKLDLKLFAIASSIVFAMLLWAQLANYPGGSYHDIYTQWSEAQLGYYNDWHPTFNSLIFRLITRVVNRYAFVVSVQILVFSLLCGYMAATLRAWGVRAFWVAMFILTILSARPTRIILLFAFKDTFLTCAILWIAVYIINILLTKGEWLKPWPNRIALAIALVFVSMVRHNGIFFSIPLVMMLFALYGKKRGFQIACSSAMALITVFLIRVPLYRAIGVERASQQAYVESVNLPSSILCSVYRTQPNALDPEARALMRTMASEKQWEELFQFGNYGSIKLPLRTELPVSLVPPPQLLAMTWNACKNAPAVSLRAALMQTRIVWDIHNWDMKSLFMSRDDMNDVDISYLSRISPELSIGAEVEAARNSAFLQAFVRPYQFLDVTLATYMPNRVLHSIGAFMLALVLFAWFSLRRRLGWETLLLVFPVLAYNIGTMLMLCHEDYRYFHFNGVIMLPFFLMLTARPPVAKEDKIRNAKKKR